MLGTYERDSNYPPGVTDTDIDYHFAERTNNEEFDDDDDTSDEDADYPHDDE